MKIKLDPTFLTVDEAEGLKDLGAEILSETVKKMATIGEEEKEVYRCGIQLKEKEGQSIWTPNQKSLINLVGAWGSESKDWIGKQIKFKIEKSSRGQKMIVAYPI